MNAANGPSSGLGLIHAPLDCAVSDERRGTVAVLGNLDGVHRGHQALIEAAAGLAAGKDAALSAVTFEPHPRCVFEPNGAPFLLTTLAQKAAILADLGCASVFALPFSRVLSSLSPEDFVTAVLAGTLGLRGVVVGEDFRFGAKRAGDARLLASLCARRGITARALGVTGAGAEKYSSTTARDALRSGEPAVAASVMGRPFAISGTVLEGRKLARQLDFPTANVALGDLIRPRYGVYAVDAVVGGETYPGIANIGVRPTVDGETELLEAHLFGFDADIYGQTIDVRLLSFIRPEQRFDGIEALKAQIARDGAAAEAVHTQR